MSRTHRVAAVALALVLLTAGCASQVGGPDRGTAPTGGAAANGEAGGGTAAADRARAATDRGADRRIEVAADGLAEAEPDQTVLRVGVVAEADDATTARRRLAENVSRMREALRAIGIGDDQVVTTRYDLDREFVRPPRPEEEPERVYRGFHGFEITLAGTDRIGEAIDTAVDSGATEVNDVRFTLSTERERELRREALADAMDNARAQADTLAERGDLRVTGVRAVRTAEVGGPRFAGERVALSGGDGGGTSVESGPVTVVASVAVTYNATAA